MTICRDLHQVTLRGLTIGSALACMFGLVQCKSEFTGPYPCETGYASCVNPENNQCETELQTDATHCGQCSKACAIGAVCVDGHCGQAAVKLTDLSGSSASEPFAQLSGNYVYYSVINAGSSSIYRASKSTGSAIETVASNLQSCGTVVPFAADANAIYYWTYNYQTSCTGGGSCNAAGIVTTTDTLATSLNWPAAQDATSQCPFAFAVTSSSVYFLGALNNGLTLDSAPLNGSSINTIATPGVAGWNTGLCGLWTDDKRALFTGSNNGQATLYQVILSSGKTTEFSSALDNQPYGISAFAADNKYVYVATSGCSCDSYGSDTLPSGTIKRFNWDGSASAELAHFSGFTSTMTIDGNFVYWATDTTVWKVPKAGGLAIQLASNLTNGATPQLCSGCSPMTNSYLSIAVDSTSVYVVDTWSGVNALLKVAK